MSLPPGFKAVQTEEAWRAEHKDHHTGETYDVAGGVRRRWLRCRDCKASILVGLEHPNDGPDQ